MVFVPRGRKDLSIIIKELDDYFLKAADAGFLVSLLLESPNCRLPSNQSLAGKMCSYGKNLSPLICTWGPNSRTSRFRRFASYGDEAMGGEIGIGGDGIASIGHCSTIEKLYAWEKKLYLEFKLQRLIHMMLENLSSLFESLIADVDEKEQFLKNFHWVRLDEMIPSLCKFRKLADLFSCLTCL